MNTDAQGKILIIDDEEIVKESISKILTSHNYAVTMVNDGVSALQLLDENPDFDVILLDIMMPKMDGFGVLKKLQANPKTVNIKVILLTALTDSENIIRAFDGGAVDYITKPFINGELLARIGTQARLKHMEDALSVQSFQYRSLLEHKDDIGLMLLENTNDLIAKISIDDNQWMYVSPASRRMLGYLPEELVGETWLTLIHPDDLQEIQAVSPPLLQDNNPFTVTLRLKHKDNSYVWTEVYIQPTYNNRNEKIIVGRDITERKRYEVALEKAYQEMENRVKDRAAELIKANVRLNQEIIDRKRAELMLEKERADLALRVEDRTAELSAANAELSHANKLKDEFLASMSHELRTPLNAILGMSESLQEYVYGELNTQQLNSIHIIEESGRHLLTLINDILDLSKIEAGKLNLQPQLIGVSNLVETSVRFIKQIAQKKHISVNVNIDPAAQLLYADQRRLKQILVNLLSNAVKFTDKGGKIGLKVKTNVQQKTIAFTIWDTGIGIAQEDMKDLFQPFSQVDSRLSRRYSGTGLGLVLVQRMTEMHGGSISVESEPEKGSQFTIFLPWEPNAKIEQTPVVNKIPRPTIPSPNATNKHIFVVDDSKVNIQTTKVYLKSKGYRISVAYNGKEAVKRLEEDLSPDLILMDIQMPEMDGLEAIQHIRNNPTLGNIPIIAVTALAMPGDEERCLAAGATDYLSKPVSLNNLDDTIERYLLKEDQENDR